MAECSASVAVEPGTVAVSVEAVVPPVAVVAAAAGAGVGSPSAIKTGASGGIVPVTCVFWVTEVASTVVIFVAVIIMPSFRPQASVSCPFTVNFCPSGILNI